MTVKTERELKYHYHEDEWEIPITVEGEEKTVVIKADDIDKIIKDYLTRHGMYKW